MEDDDNEEEALAFTSRRVGGGALLNEPWQHLKPNTEEFCSRLCDRMSAKRGWMDFLQMTRTAVPLLAPWGLSGTSPSML